MPNLQAIIMAGGEGSRLKPVTCTVPKPLVKICSKPCIEYILELLARSGFKRASVTISYLGRQIEEHFDGKSFAGVELSFCSESSPLGTAGSVRNAWDGKSDVLVLSGDALCDFDLSAFCEFHKKKRPLASIIVKSVSDPREFGLTSLSSDGRVLGFIEKPSYESCATDLANTGIYIISAELMAQIPFGVSCDFAKDIFPKIVSDGAIYGFEEKGYWCDIGDIKSLLKCQTDLLEGRGRLELSAHRNLNGLCFKGQNSYRGVTIKSPSYIGANVTIGTGAVIESGSVIEDNAVIGEGAKIHGSIVGKGARVGQKATLINAIVCPNAWLGDNTCCYEHSVIGASAIIGECCVVEGGVRIWAGKQIEKNTNVCFDVKYGYTRAVVIDDEGWLGDGQCGLSPQTATLYGSAVGTAVALGESVVVGFSGNGARALYDAFCAGAVASGANVWKLGECCEAQLRFCADLLGAKLSAFIVSGVSARVRLLAKGGLHPTREVERVVEGAINRRDTRLCDAKGYGAMLETADLKELYSVHLRALLPDFLKGVNVEIKTSSAVIADIFNKTLHRINDIRGEKIVFHFAQDTSRVSAYSEKTGYVFHERLCLLGLKLTLENGFESAVPYSFPTVAQQLCTQSSQALHRYYNTPCNSSDEYARQVATRPENIFIRDGIELMCRVSAYLSQNGLTLFDAVKSLPDFCTSQRFVSVSESAPQAIKKLKCDSEVANEGVIYQTELGRAVVRPIKSGKGIMLFVEATRSELATALCDELERRLKSE